MREHWKYYCDNRHRFLSTSQECMDDIFDHDFIENSDFSQYVSNKKISFYPKECVCHQENKEVILEQIAESFLFKRHLQEGNGLFRGKMGIAIFYFLYARHRNSIIFEDFAGELVNDVCEDIHSATPIDIRDGLCGIGWGVEYLVQQRFIEGDTDEILEDIDQKIMGRDLKRITDFSMETGLEGILWYALMRLTSPYSKQAFDETYRVDLYMVCKKHSLYVATLLLRVLDGEEIGKYPYWKILSLLVSHQNNDELLWKKGISILL